MSEPTERDEPERGACDEEQAAPAGPIVAEGVGVSLVVAASAYQVVDTAAGAGEADAAVGRIGIEGAPTAGPGEAGGAPVLEAIGRLSEELGGRIDRLQAVVDRELRAESSREKVVDRLHAELQDYKNDLLLKVTRPIFIDLIQLHDDLGKMAEAIGEERTAAVLRDVQQGIEDVLYRQGVEPFRVEGDAFDPRRQRAVSTVATEDPGVTKRIAARLRPGFASGEKVIRPELVSVFALRKGPAAGEGGEAPPRP